MSPGLSAHLIDSYDQENYRKQTKIPFQRLDQKMTNILQAGNMSYNANLQGLCSFQGPNLSPNFSLEDGYQETNMSTLQSIATLQAKLNQKLGPEYISQRPAPGGSGKLSYIEGWKIIALANEVFGFNGWSSNIVSLNVDFIDCMEDSKRFNVGATAIVRVTLRDGVYHEDVGYGLLENSKSKGQAIDKCKKEAVTDGLKRTLRNFGNLMGNCLYDKSYTSEVVKIKVPPTKFDKSTLHRRPEFDDNASASTSAAAKQHPPQPPATKQESAIPAAAPKSHQESALPEAQCRLPPPPPQPARRGNPIHIPQGHNANNQNKPISSGSAERRAAAVAAAFDDLPSGGTSSGNTNTRQGAISNANGTAVANTTTRSNESFAFPSDDDAFFASVDLDVDMGRPIDYGDEEVSGEGMILPQQQQQDRQRAPDSKGPVSGPLGAGSGTTAHGNVNGMRQPPAQQQQRQQYQQQPRQPQPQANGGGTHPTGHQSAQMTSPVLGRQQNQNQGFAPPPPRQNPNQMNGHTHLANGGSAQRSSGGTNGAGPLRPIQAQPQPQGHASKPISNGPYPTGGQNANTIGGLGLKRDSAGFQRPLGPGAPSGGSNGTFRPPLRDIDIAPGADAKRPRMS